MAWHVYTKNTKLKTGDIIEASAKPAFLVHYGVIYEKDGEQYISHCPLKEGFPVVEKLSEFKKKRLIFRYFRNYKTEQLTNEDILSKSAELQSHPYDPVVMNCEDYVKYVTGVESLGLDLRVGIAITIVVVIVVIIVIYKLRK